MDIDSNISDEIHVERVHIWNHCHNCKAEPIIGIRYQCEACPAGPDIDLCEPCYNLLQQGKIKHPSEDSLSHTEGIKKHWFSQHEGKPVNQFDDWFTVQSTPTPEPRLSFPFVVRPIFSAGGDSTIAGYGFVVNSIIPGQTKPLFLTALHVMDELIKLKGIDCTSKNPKYTGKELPGLMTGVDLFDVFAQSWMMAHLGSTGPMLVLPGARIHEEEPYSDKDIAAFIIKDLGMIKPASLAPEPPSVGDSIWLVARALDKASPQLFKATVVEITDRSMVFFYDDLSEKPKYTSGAPIVNHKGEVAGIIVGSGKLNNQKIGHANHVGNIRKHLLS